MECGHTARGLDAACILVRLASSLLPTTWWFHHMFGPAVRRDERQSMNASSCTDDMCAELYVRSSRAMTTAVQLHLIMAVASNSQRPPGQEKPGRMGQNNNKRSNKARRCAVQQEMQFYVISINTMMHVAGLIGTLVPADEVSKWMYWIFGCAMFAMICNQLTSTQSQIWKVAKKNKVLDVLRSLTRTTIAVWALYPVMWALADGSRTIQWEIKELLYIILDLWAKFSFTMVFLVSCTHDVLPAACQARLEWVFGSRSGRFCQCGSRCKTATVSDKARQREVERERREGRQQGTGARERDPRREKRTLATVAGEGVRGSSSRENR